MSPQPKLRDFIPDGTFVADGVEAVCEQLEAAGWYPRSRWGAHSVRYWQDGRRPQQITIDLRFAMNEHRAGTLSERTGVALDAVEAKEE